MDQYQYYFLGEDNRKTDNLKQNKLKTKRKDKDIITVNNRLKRIYGYNTNKSAKNKKIWYDSVFELSNNPV